MPRHLRVAAVSAFQGARRGLPRRGARRQPGADACHHDSHREEREHRQRRGAHGRAHRAQLAVAEISGEEAQDGSGNAQTENDAEQRAGDAECGALADERALQLAARHPERPQQCERSASAQHRQRLRREDQERAGPQRDQRQHIQIDPIGARHGDGTVALDLRRHGHDARGQASRESAAKGLDVDALAEAQIDAIQPANLIERPLRRGNVHQPERLRIGSLRQNAEHAQRLGRAADDDLQRIAGAQLQLLCRAAAEIQGVRLQQREDAAADVADERRLQRGRAERVEPQHFERVAPAGQGDVEFQHGTRDTHGGITRQQREQLLGKAFARTAHHHVRLAHQALRGQAKFVERGVIHQVHGCAQGHAESDGEHGDQEARRLFAHLRQQQHAPNHECAARFACAAHLRRPERFEAADIEHHDAVGRVGGGARVGDQNAGAGVCFDLLAQ